MEEKNIELLKILFGKCCIYIKCYGNNDKEVLGIVIDELMF